MLRSDDPLSHYRLTSLANLTSEIPCACATSRLHLFDSYIEILEPLEVMDTAMTIFRRSMQ